MGASASDRSAGDPRPVGTPDGPDGMIVPCLLCMPEDCYNAGCEECSTEQCPYCEQFFRAALGHDAIKHHVEYCLDAPEDDYGE